MARNDGRKFLRAVQVGVLLIDGRSDADPVYRRQKEFFENGAVAFQAQEGPPHRQVEEKQKRIEFLGQKVQAKNEVLAEVMAEHVPLKNDWGTLTGSWVPHDVRDQVVDFVRRWSEKTEIGVGRFIIWLGVTASMSYDWRERYGCVNEHNGWVPRDFWLERWEKKTIIDFRMKNPLDGYRRLTFMILDADVVAVSPASVWRVLRQAGLLSRSSFESLAWRMSEHRPTIPNRTAKSSVGARRSRASAFGRGHRFPWTMRFVWIEDDSKPVFC